MPDHSLQSQSSVDSPPTECGWTLGFHRGTHCTEPPADGESLCAPHAKADRRITKYAKEAAFRAERNLSGFGGDVADVRALLGPRTVAERWWVENGVRAIPAPVRREVLSSGLCAYCGQSRPTEVDHIFPVSRGGTSEPANLAPSCRPCNKQKSDMTVDEWRQARLAAGVSWPPRHLPQLRRQASRDLESGDAPPHLADLLRVPAPEPPPKDFRDDPRWQAANEAFGVEMSCVDAEAQYMRQCAAIELMYQIERSYEAEDTE